MTVKGMRAWSTRLLGQAARIEQPVRLNPAGFSERAIGEAQGYAMALRQMSATLERKADALVKAGRE